MSFLMIAGSALAAEDAPPFGSIESQEYDDFRKISVLGAEEKLEAWAGNVPNERIGRRDRVAVTEGFLTEGAQSSGVPEVAIISDGDAAVYVIQGGDDFSGASYDTERLGDQSGRFTFISYESQIDELGPLSTISSIGDFNADGYNDLAFSFESGDVIILFGNRLSVGQTATFDSLVFPGSGNGFHIRPPSDAVSSGAPVGAIGDFNGDGADDIIMSFMGRGYLLFGSVSPPELMELEGLGLPAGLVFENDLGLEISWPMSGIGDINSDGYDDFAMRGRVFPESNGGSSVPGLFIVFGSENPGAIDNVMPPDSIGDGFTIVDNSNFTFLLPFFSVSPAGDFDGDGDDDFVIGFPFSSTNCEICTSPFALVVSGGQFKGLNPSVPIRFDWNDLEALRITTTNVVFPMALGSDGQDYEGFFELGWSVSELGDLNHDGYSDIVVGDPTAHIGGEDGSIYFGPAGSAFIVFGRENMGPAPVNVSDIGPDQISNLVVPVQSFNFQTRVGEFVAAAGDYNSDGTADLLVTEPLGVVEDITTEYGKVHIFSGKALASKLLLTSLDVEPNTLVAGEDLSILWSAEPLDDAVCELRSEGLLIESIEGTEGNEIVATGSLQGGVYEVVLDCSYANVDKQISETVVVAEETSLSMAAFSAGAFASSRFVAFDVMNAGQSAAGELSLIIDLPQGGEVDNIIPLLAECSVEAGESSSVNCQAGQSVWGCEVSGSSVECQMEALPAGISSGVVLQFPEGQQGLLAGEVSAFNASTSAASIQIQN